MEYDGITHSAIQSKPDGVSSVSSAFLGSDESGRCHELLGPRATHSVPERVSISGTHQPAAKTLKRVVYVPRNLERGHNYPLVVYLHGSCGECVTHERILRGLKGTDGFS